MSWYRGFVWYFKGLREYSKSGYDSASKHFREEDMRSDISKRSFMVTGANSGIGKEAAMAIARQGGIVHMVCRNRERGEAALEEIKRVTGNQNVYLHELDVSRPRDVFVFAQNYKNRGKPLHVLINNAGALVTEKERQLTPDGLEVSFATNSLGTHIMTTAFVPVLSKSEDPRVIIMTSGASLIENLEADDVQFEKMKPFDGIKAYLFSKRHQMFMIQEYSKMYPNIHFSCTHPGWADTPGVQATIPDFYEKNKQRFRSAEQGADTAVWLAVAPCVRDHPSGLFFQDRKPISYHLPLAWSKPTQREVDKLMTTLTDMAKTFQPTQ